MNDAAVDQQWRFARFRLWLDGREVVADWSNNVARYKSTRVTLRKNQRVGFKLEYFQGKGQRSLRLAWWTPSQLRDLERQRAEVDDIVHSYLPAGARWYDFWTNERFNGGERAERKVPLDKFPLFVRAGSIVTLGPDVQYATERPDAPYEIRIYPGANGAFPGMVRARMLNVMVMEPGRASPAMAKSASYDGTRLELVFNDRVAAR